MRPHPTRKDQALNPVRLNLTFVAIVLVSAGGFGSAFVVPGLRELDARRKTISVELDNAQQSQAAVSDMSVMYANVLRLKEREFQLWERIPVEPKSGEFANGLAKCLANCGINKFDIQQEPSMEVDGSKLPETLRLASNITVLPVTIKFEATYKQVSKFLDGVEKMPRLAHIDDLKLQNKETKPGRLQVVIVLHAYHRHPM